MRLRFRLGTLCFLLALFFVLVLGASAQEKDSDGTHLPSTATLPRDYPVLTLQGVCTLPASNPKIPCKTVVTRAQFEKMVDSINPRMTKFERHQLAQNYGQLLILANEAERIGLDKDPRVREMLRYSQLRVLAGAMVSKNNHDAAEAGIDEKETTEYYKENPRIFERFTIQRIFVPREKQGVTEKLPENSPAAATPADGEMKELAEKIQQRAVAGEDFDKLQKEVFQQAGMTGEPKTTMEDISRATLTDAHTKMLEMPVGKVSQVLEDPSGYYVYKVVSKKTPRYETVKEEVGISLKEKKAADGMARIKKNKSASLNNDYFDRYDPPAPDPNEPEGDED